MAEASEIQRLKTELDAVKRQRDALLARDRLAMGVMGWIFIGPALGRCMRAWLRKATPTDPFPRDEFADVLTASFVRIVRVGFVGFVLANCLLFWQNILIYGQNKFFKEQLAQIERQTAELRSQYAFQREQSLKQFQLLQDQTSAMLGQLNVDEDQLKLRQVEYELSTEREKSRRQQAYREFQRAIDDHYPRIQSKQELVRRGLARQQDLSALIAPVEASFAQVVIYGSEPVKAAAERMMGELVDGEIDKSSIERFQALVDQDLGSGSAK